MLVQVLVLIRSIHSSMNKMKGRCLQSRPLAPRLRTEGTGCICQVRAAFVRTCFSFLAALPLPPLDFTHPLPSHTHVAMSPSNQCRACSSSYLAMCTRSSMYVLVARRLEHRRTQPNPTLARRTAHVWIICEPVVESMFEGPPLAAARNKARYGVLCRRLLPGLVCSKR
jgi:hypothetical protein